MKNTIKTFALFLTAGAMLASCDSYLDRQPDAHQNLHISH